MNPRFLIARSAPLEIAIEESGVTPEPGQPVACKVPKPTENMTYNSAIEQMVRHFAEAFRHRFGLDLAFRAALDLGDGNYLYIWEAARPHHSIGDDRYVDQS